MPNLLLTNIAVGYIAVFLVRLQKMSFNISSEALKAMSVYFIYYTIWTIIDNSEYIKANTVFSKSMERMSYIFDLSILVLHCEIEHDHKWKYILVSFR